MNVKVYNQQGEETGTVELPDSVFGLSWNADLVHQVVTSYAANVRQGIAHTKGRGEVRGGGKKPWRQKGTGRARHGSIRSPIWRGGGVTHGPNSEKNYKKKINKKMAKKALYTTLSAKAREGQIIVMDSLDFSEPKTKFAAGVFDHMRRVESLKAITRGNGVLVAFPERNQASMRAMRNLSFVALDEVRNLNAYEVLQYKYLMFPKSAIEMFK